MELGYEEAVTDWAEPPESKNTGTLPVALEQYIKNVRDNCLLDLPDLTVQREHDRVMVMVCGGPTAGAFLEDIRARRANDGYRIFCSNKTHDWLIENGIIPHYMFIIDPKESKLRDVEHPHPDVEYLIGISCDHRVFKALEGYRVTRIFSVSGVGDPRDTDVIRALLPYRKIDYVVGGSMAGLRAMSIADVMGYTRVEYYGFDSCFFETDEKGEPVYYSYPKRRSENIIEARTAEGAVFLTSPVLASQARQFIKWKHRFAWIDFTVCGYSLTSEIDRIDTEKNKPKHDLLITEAYRKLNMELHARPSGSDPNGLGGGLYGTTGSRHSGTVAVLAGKLIRKYGRARVLDYGCGKRTLEADLPPIDRMELVNYDPCVDGLDAPPAPADLVVCTDVLEHVEPECLENVLDDLARVTQKIGLFSIATRVAGKYLSDGRNAHLIVEDHEWWMPRLKKRFFVLEARRDNAWGNIVVLVQSKKLIRTGDERTHG